MWNSYRFAQKLREKCVRERMGGERGLEGVGKASPWPPAFPTPALSLLCFLFVPGPVLCRWGPDTSTVCLCRAWAAAFPFPACRAGLQAECQRHRSRQTSWLFLPNSWHGKFCGVRLMQALPSGRVSGLWGWADLDSRLHYLQTWESFWNCLNLSFFICKTVIINVCHCLLFMKIAAGRMKAALGITKSILWYNIASIRRLKNPARFQWQLPLSPLNRD